jgi:hypothetical protein
VATVAAELEEELADVGVGLGEDEEDGILGNDGDDGQTARVLEDGRRQLAATCRETEVVSRRDNQWNVSGDILGGQSGDRLAIDQQSIAAQDDRGVDPFALPDCRDEVTDGGHG